MQRFLRAQAPEVVGTTIVDRAWALLKEGELIDPAVPAQLIVRVMERGLSGTSSACTTSSP